MEQDFKKPVFYRAFMTSVFVGIIITVIAMIYDLSFKENTGFPYSVIINVSTLIFGINIFFLVIGTIYYWCVKASKVGEIIFIALFVFLTVLVLIKIKGIQRTNDAFLNMEFRELFSGIIIIVGIGVAIMVPLLYHSKKFEENVL